MKARTGVLGLVHSALANLTGEPHEMVSLNLVHNADFCTIVADPHSGAELANATHVRATRPDLKREDLVATLRMLATEPVRPPVGGSRSSA